MLYRGFPSKLHHEVPHWVENGALFHIRIGVDRQSEQSPLTAVSLAPRIVRLSAILREHRALVPYSVPSDA